MFPSVKLILCLKPCYGTAVAQAEILAVFSAAGRRAARGLSVVLKGTPAFNYYFF